MEIVLYGISSVIQMLVYTFALRELLGMRRNVCMMLPCWLLTELINQLTTHYCEPLNLAGVIAAYLGTALFLCRGSAGDKIFVAVTYGIITGVSDLIVAGTIVFSGLSTMEQLQTTWECYGAQILTQILVLFCICLILPMWKKRPEDELAAGDWLRLIGMFFVCFLAVVLLGAEMMYSQRCSIALFFVFLIILIINLSSYYFYRDLVQKKQLETALQVSENQLQLYSQFAESIRLSRSQTDEFRHDVKNHMAAISGLCRAAMEEGSTEPRIQEISDYLDEIGASYRKVVRETDTGNLILDSIIDVKKDYAKTKGIGVNLTLNLPANLEIDNLDLVILLGNILDNAIEACQLADAGRDAPTEEKPATEGATFAEKEESVPVIRLRMEYALRRLAIFLENTYDGHLDGGHGSIDEDRLPGTTKVDSKSHGIGLRNVRQVVEKYHGTMNWEGKEKVFSLEILLDFSDQ